MIERETRRSSTYICIDAALYFSTQVKRGWCGPAENNTKRQEKGTNMSQIMFLDFIKQRNSPFLPANDKGFLHNPSLGKFQFYTSYTILIMNHFNN